MRCQSPMAVMILLNHVPGSTKATVQNGTAGNPEWCDRWRRLRVLARAVPWPQRAPAPALGRSGELAEAAFQARLTTRRTARRPKGAFHPRLCFSMDDTCSHKA